MYEPWSACGAQEDGADGAAVAAGVADGMDPTASKRDENDCGQEGRSARSERSQSNNCHAMWVDGTVPVLKAFDVGAGSSMVTDHLTTSYERSLALLDRHTA